MRIAVPDLISNSYFPVIAAVELGFFKSEGLDTKKVELLFPVPKTMEALRDGELDLAVGSAHATLSAFPDWKGARLLVALAQRMYWFLVLRSDLRAKRGDLSAVKGLRIGAAPGPDLGLQRRGRRTHGRAAREPRDRDEYGPRGDSQQAALCAARLRHPRDPIGNRGGQSLLCRERADPPGYADRLGGVD